MNHLSCFKITTYISKHVLQTSLFLLLFVFGITLSGFSQTPSGFQDNEFATDFNGVNGVTFDAAGRMYVWEKGGKVWNRTSDGVWHELLNIADEVNQSGDSGLKGFTLHPNFTTNGYFYLLYEVDRHHLMSYGTANYDPDSSDFQNASIARITRYTIDINNFTSLVSNSRLVLLGTSPTDGIPFIHDTHNAGSLIFGTDGTLIASCGESSATNADDGSADFTYYQQALLDGILKSDDPNTSSVNENENVGSWRAQMIDCLSGKILRIDPMTGNGISSNPYYDINNPRAAKSRVWAMGFRNPFRITLKPNTGSHLPSAGNPGTIYVGEVGSFSREEINTVTSAGQNFGWPVFEGMDELISPRVQYPFGRDEFTFPIINKKPAVDYRPYPARAFVNNEIREIGTSAPNAIAGIDFVGGCSIGGVFYTGTNFPPEYQGRYLHANFNNNDDPGQSWLHGFTMDANDELSQMHSFLPNALSVTCMAVNPVNGYLYYASYGGAIREVKYDTGNQPPVAIASQNVQYGTSPLSVNFTGSQSTDPENGALTYAWNFGDGSSVSTDANPTHIFTAPDANPIRYDVTLTVTDNQNQTNSTSLIVSANNTPPAINSTTVDNMSVYANTSIQNVSLQANVIDAQTPTNQLAFKWETALFHNTHHHPEPVSIQQSSNIILTPIPCVNETYYYQVKLTVTDAQGLSATKTKNIVPDCGQVFGDITPPSNPSYLQTTSVSANSISLIWDKYIDDVGVTMYEIFKNDVLIDQTIDTSYTATGLQAETFYLFKVRAKDATGNTSGFSNQLGVNTIAPIVSDELIYGDALGTDWLNFSSISSLNLGNTILPFINSKSIKVSNPVANQELDLRFSGTPHNTSDYPNGLEFWVYNSSSTSYPFQVQIFTSNSGGGSSFFPSIAEPNKWNHFLLDWSLLGNPSQIGKILIRLNQTQTESLYFDEIKLVHCADMNSVQTGNWNTPSTWSCGRVPISTDIITINTGHTVTVLNGVSATLRLLQQLGTLNIQTGGIFNINKY
jgi:glucose/arabinose dehydrogenase